MSIMDRLRNGIRSWLRIQPAMVSMINIQEVLDFEGNAIKNRIWYRGDSEEISQLYAQLPGDRTRFWAASSTAGMEIQKKHIGLPAIMVDIMANVVMADMNDIVVDNMQFEWDEIARENKFSDIVEKAIVDTLVIGDGAFKISMDDTLSQYPILEFYPGDRIDVKRRNGRVQEIVFKTVYRHNSIEYVLHETYGHGYITYKLYKDNAECSLALLPETAGLVDVGWNENFMMAEYISFYPSKKWEGRGKSVFDSKIDEFDSLDEIWSQWMDALRANRTRQYIPEDMLPRNPNTGEVLAPNAFDNRYIQCDSPMQENINNKEISLKQGQIPHESYLSTYITALDLCLQGFMSPSTLGIDVKKLDNAEAQREKEKATLYTRNNIVNVLQEVLPRFIGNVLKTYAEMTYSPVEDIDVEIPFGEYANPSFESVVETVSKARSSQIMSVEAAVEEMYGDSKDEEWKSEEVQRIKAEAGIVELDEVSVGDDVDAAV